MSVAFNGTDEEADTPDATELSFGDGASDQPFSIVALVRVTAGTAVQGILTKYDVTTGSTKREWRFGIDASERPLS